MTTSSIRNKLLKSLASEDLALLQPYLVSQSFPQRHHFERPKQAIAEVCFPETAVVSVVAQQRDLLVEVGLIGCEGMTGTAVILGTDRPAHATFVQIAGDGLRMPAQDLRKALDTSPTMRGVFLRYVQVMAVQTAHTAIANSVAKLHERLARWLLMAHDRASGDTLVLTHEFLAIMLAVRRAGVTEAVQALEADQLILHKRGVVTVLDRKGLEKVAGDFYGAPEREYRRLVLAAH
jgi:CRP-like cAMP-binding protein